MGFFEHWQFFFCLIVLLIPAVILGTMEKPLKHYSMGVSLFFIACIVGPETAQLVYLILFFILEWGVIRAFLVLYKQYGRDETTYHLTIVISLLPLVISKLQPFIGLDIFCFVGISYITFKVVQILIEIYDGVIDRVGFYEYAAFLLFFPTLSSGPIDRSRRFLEDWNHIYDKEAYLQLCTSGIIRLLGGYIYKTILAGRCYMYLIDAADKSGLLNEIRYAYLYGLYLFFDFAGYSLMAVGTSYVLGIRTPDNFNMPFLSRDIREFWDRWHICLSHWFRDFIFTRFVMRCKKKKWFHTKLQRANAGFLVNMFVMGVWHGLNVSYLLYGLYHGALLALTETYQKKSGFYKQYKDTGWYQIVSWAVTMQLYMFGFYIFSGRWLEWIPN